MHDWLTLSGPLGKQVTLMTWAGASAFDRACALGRSDAARLLDHIFFYGFRDLRLYRHDLLALIDVPPFDSAQIGDADLRDLLLHHLSFSRRLILVPEIDHPAPCGSGGESQRKSSVQDGGRHSPDGDGSWGGDSRTWSQEKKLDSLHPALRPKVQATVADLAKGGFQPTIFFGWRSVAVQLEIVKQGHSKVKFSFHNAQKKDGTPRAYAADIIDKRWAWSPDAEKHGFWSALGAIAKRYGLYWGGDWKTFKDVAHVQLVPNSALGRVKKESGL